MKREFIENLQVSRALRISGVSDEHVCQMETQIMLGLGDTVPQTAGIKKIRCGAAGRGKRGGVRVLFADYPKAGKTYLLAALSKAQQADFSKDELKVLRRLKKQLDALHGS